MKQITKISLATLGMLPASVFAADIPSVTPVTPTGNLDVASVLSTVIYWILGLSGGVAVLFLILGGLQYITSSGNKDKAEQAKQTILYAVIGLIVIALSFVIVAFVSQNVGKVTQ
ncbi:MAG: pilin [Patescibacteria group bacterium]|nr:pilin [Patescibacteria group bacterium]